MLRLSRTWPVLVVLVLFCAIQVSAQVVATYDFEDGTVQGWTSFNGASTPVNTAAAAFTGTHSLLTTTGSGGQGGPGISLSSLLLPGAQYTITARVMLTSGESATSANFTIKRMDSSCSGGVCYDTIGAFEVAVSASGWAQIGGSYTVSENETGLFLYAQLVGPTTEQSFYLDDVVITETAPPPSVTSIATYTFADGGLDGWFPFGSPTLTNSAAPVLDPNGDAHALLTTNRTAGFMGPALNFLNLPGVAAGATYQITAWVLLAAPDSGNPTATMSTELTNCANPSGSFTNIATSGALSSTAWTQLQGTFSFSNVPAAPTSLTLYIQSSSATDSFYIDDVVISQTSPPPPGSPITIQISIPSIYQELSYFFPIGAEINTTDLSGPHAQLLTRHFNSIVSGNDMKWSSVENTKGTFTYGNADNEVGFAVCNEMQVRGHNLVWATGAQTPSYAFGDGTNSPANQATVTANIQEHIQNEVTHFGNKVYVWDVVNEPLDPAQPDCLDHGPFYQVLGKSYIDIALQAARQFAPAGTKLFLNDYDTTEPARLACLVQVVEDLRNRGIPIDGVGHETHNKINFPSVTAMVNAINLVAATIPNLDQQVTELDESVYTTSQVANPTVCAASDYNVTNGGVVPPSILAEQGWLFAQYFNALRQLKGKISAITFWGMADDDTWLSTFPCTHLDEPLPFDSGLQAKPAYWGIVDPTQLPGYGLTLTIASKTGSQNARVWTITAANPGSSPGPAYAVQITGFTLQQTGGAACTPVITPPGSFPVSLGNISPGNAANASFTIDFTGCPALARFTLNMPWSSAVYDTGTLVSGNQFR
ncbi:MAG: endo-1,4-beta-xylanase [Bryobacteraceae bacterium]|jgi:endo-1,4-beta-xylanase